MDVKLNVNIKAVFPLLLILLTACGGSDGDVDEIYSNIDGKNSPEVPSNTVNVQIPAFSISSDNLEITTTIAIDSIFNNLALNMSKSLTGSEVSTSSSQLYLPPNLQNFTRLKRAFSSASDSSKTVSKEVTDCAISGSLTTTISLQNPLKLSPNDSFKFENANCHDGSSVSNGTFIYKFTQLVNFNSFEHYDILGLDVIFDGYSIEFLDDNKTVTVSSKYSVLITQDEYLHQVAITSPLLATVVNDYMSLSQNLTVDKTYNKNENVETVNASTYLINGALFGEITISTLKDFNFNGQGSDTPFSGSMKIEANNGSSIILTVLNSNDIQLEADFDGDEMIDETRVISWESLSLN